MLSKEMVETSIDSIRITSGESVAANLKALVGQQWPATESDLARLIGRAERKHEREHMASSLAGMNAACNSRG